MKDFFDVILSRLAKNLKLKDKFVLWHVLTPVVALCLIAGTIWVVECRIRTDGISRLEKDNDALSTQLESAKDDCANDKATLSAQLDDAHKHIRLECNDELEALRITIANIQKESLKEKEESTEIKEAMCKRLVHLFVAAESAIRDLKKLCPSNCYQFDREVADLKELAREYTQCENLQEQIKKLWKERSG